MTPDELETRIKEYGLLMLAAHAQWEAHGCFQAKADADRFLRLQNEAIRARSPETVRRMEMERGLG